MEVKKTMLSVDGNTAAALGSYNFIEVVTYSHLSIRRKKLVERQLT